MVAAWDLKSHGLIPCRFESDHLYHLVLCSFQRVVDATSLKTGRPDRRQVRNSLSHYGRLAQSDRAQGF